MSDPADISVVIPHLNQPAALARCLASLAAGTRAPGEILVVDNGSAALPRDVCAEVPGVRLLEETTPGPGPARNCGVAASRGAVLAFIDADCLADPAWIETIAHAFADPAAEVLGGDVRIALDDPSRVTVLEAYESEYAYRMDRYIAREGFTGTGNLAVRRRVLEAVGPFAGLDVAEDRDWGQRASRAGVDLRYVPGMRVYHPARTDFGGLAAKWDRQSAHDYTRFRARRFGRAAWLARSLAMAASPPAELPRIWRSERIPGARAKTKATLGLARIRLYRARVMLRLLATDDPGALSGRWNR